MSEQHSSYLDWSADTYVGVGGGALSAALRQDGDPITGMNKEVVDTAIKESIETVTNLQCSASDVHSQIRGDSRKSLSPSDPMIFPDKTRRLGPGVLPVRWGWKVEIIATVPDDPSKYSITQTFTQVISSTDKYGEAFKTTPFTATEGLIVAD